MKSPDLGETLRYHTVHRGGLYFAEISRWIYADRPFRLDVYYVDSNGMRHAEFSCAYKTFLAAFKKLASYWKGENAEWQPED